MHPAPALLNSRCCAVQNPISQFHITTLLKSFTIRPSNKFRRLEAQSSTIVYMPTKPFCSLRMCLLAGCTHRLLPGMHKWPNMLAMASAVLECNNAGCNAAAAPTATRATRWRMIPVQCFSAQTLQCKQCTASTQALGNMCAPRELALPCVPLQWVASWPENLKGLPI
jgi:hypothetical protein